ncbi:MAG: phospholipase D-like domain-containing protein [Chloroflexota bacterium]
MTAPVESRPGRSGAPLRRLALPAAALATAAAVGLRVRAKRRVAWPVPDDAISASGARDHTTQLLARPRLTRHDLAMSLAPSHATSVEPLLHGRRYFPRILEDIEAATDHVHLLIYGYKEGDIGRRFLEALSAKVAEGVEVRLAVDAIGSEIDGGSKGLYRELVAAGVQVVANEGLLSFRTGPLGARRQTRHVADLLHFDHRKMVVIDGRIGWVGGSGIEDHYNDERFYDVMCRMSGPIVAQLALVFLATWRYRGGPAPADIDRYFPPDVVATPDVATAIPATLLWNVPGTGHHPISDAIERSLEDAVDGIDIVNPYISNRAILGRLLAASERGVRVRLVAPGKPTPPFPAAAFRHAYPALLDAGAEIVLHPEMAHAKVVRVDDRVLIGGCNLDDLSLFRNDELDVLFEHPTMPALAEASVFDELVGMSQSAAASDGRRARAWEATMSRVSRFL